MKELLDNLLVGDYLIMYILAQGGKDFARIDYKTDFDTLSSVLPVSHEIEIIDEWEEEYKKYVAVENTQRTKSRFPFLHEEQPFLNKNMDISQIDNFTSSPENLLSAGEMLEEVYARFNVDTYEDLLPSQLNILENKYGKGINLYLPGLEEEYINSFDVCSVNKVMSILSEYGVKNLDAVDDNDWKEIMLKYNARKTTILAAERLLDYKDNNYE